MTTEGQRFPVVGAAIDDLLAQCDLDEIQRHIGNKGTSIALRMQLQIWRIRGMGEFKAYKERRDCRIGKENCEQLWKAFIQYLDDKHFGRVYRSHLIAVGAELATKHGVLLGAQCARLDSTFLDARTLGTIAQFPKCPLFPLSTRMSVFYKLTKLLERHAWEFTNKHCPEVLTKYGWTTQYHLELHRWTPLIAGERPWLAMVQKLDPPGSSPGVWREAMKQVAKIRHMGVHPDVRDEECIDFDRVAAVFRDARHFVKAVAGHDSDAATTFRNLGYFVDNHWRIGFESRRARMQTDFVSRLRNLRCDQRRSTRIHRMFLTFEYRKADNLVVEDRCKMLERMLSTDLEQFGPGKEWDIYTKSK